VSPDVLLPLAVSIALAVPIVVVLWHVLVVGGDLRRDAQLGRAAVDIAHRTDLSLDELSAVVDDLRRHRTEPGASASSIQEALYALSRYAEEAAVVDKHVPAAVGDGLKAEIDRAQRAIELIEHGRLRLIIGSSEGLSEGETSIKRGYLNLLHARDAIKAKAEAILVAADPAGAEARRRLRNR
jgi:hypothetical protein